MSLSSYATYFFLVLALVYSPGPMTLYLMSNGMRSRLRNLYPILLGANHAYLLAIIIFTVGLANLLQQHQLLFKSLQITGIIYLLYLFVKQWNKKTLLPDTAANTENKINKSGLYAKGALVALSNPKTLILFTIVFPQFATRGNDYYWQIIILGATFLVLQFSSGCFYAFLGSRISHIFQDQGNQRFINRLSALVLLFVAMLLLLRI